MQFTPISCLINESFILLLYVGNCGGAGICGTCAVKVINGKENCNQASKNEINTITAKRAKDKDRIGEIRLSCCTRVSGPIEIQTKP